MVREALQKFDIVLRYIYLNILLFIAIFNLPQLPALLLPPLWSLSPEDALEPLYFLFPVLENYSTSLVVFFFVAFLEELRVILYEIDCFSLLLFLGMALSATQ